MRQEKMIETDSVGNLSVSATRDRIWIGPNFAFEFQRTLRLPDDGKSYPLPPGLGALPIFKSTDYGDRMPALLKAKTSFFIPMYQREALWLNFVHTGNTPHAVKVAVGSRNVFTSDRLSRRFSADKQDYMVCPPQEWLDGIKTGSGVVRQFVAMPFGSGYSVEEQLTGEEKYGGIQVAVFEPKPGYFPPPYGEVGPLKSVIAPAGQMAIAPGAKITQKIYEDPHGYDAWASDRYGAVAIHIVNSLAFRELTGLKPPETPISAHTYAEHGLPWYDIYDEDRQDVRTVEELYTIKSVSLMDKIKGLLYQQDDSPLNVDPKKIRKYVIGKDGLMDGSREAKLDEAFNKLFDDN